MWGWIAEARFKCSLQSNYCMKMSRARRELASKCHRNCRKGIWKNQHLETFETIRTCWNIWITWKNVTNEDETGSGPWQPKYSERRDFISVLRYSDSWTSRTISLLQNEAWTSTDAGYAEVRGNYLTLYRTVLHTVQNVDVQILFFSPLYLCLFALIYS